jgi:predicted O-linked N-acetylglucosamine transferase (SPINDLY family)
LPETGFVFCCFNTTYKIIPEVFAAWMKLLGAVEGSVLWLLETNPTAAQNLRNEAKARGISPERLIFAPKLPLAEHLSRHRLADLFLDTLPYNAHTTASDALRAGLPLVTCLGETFAGRVAASLLKAVGLSELITTSLEDYETLALKLACEPSLLAAIKAKLARNRDTYPLFDTGRFTLQIEAAYTTMWQRYQSGAAPQAFAVAPIERSGTDLTAAAPKIGLDQ